MDPAKSSLYNHSDTMTKNEYFKRLKKHSEKKKVTSYFDEFLAFSDTHNCLVLDCGCGIGYLSQRLEFQGNEVISIDINRYMLRYAKKELKLGNPILASAYSIPFLSESFEAVYFIDVLEHLEKPLEALKEFYRVLKFGGRLLLITPNGLYRKIMPKALYFDPTHIHEFTWNELRNLIWKTGFNIVSSRVAEIPFLDMLHSKISSKVTTLAPKIFLPLAYPSFWLEMKKV